MHSPVKVVPNVIPFEFLDDIQVKLGGWRGMGVWVMRVLLVD